MTPVPAKGPEGTFRKILNPAIMSLQRANWRQCDSPSIRGTTSLQRANWRFPSASEFSSRLAGTFLYPVETVGAQNSVGGGENIFLAFLQTVPDHDTPSSTSCMRGSYYAIHVRGYAVLPVVDIRS